MSSEEPPIKKQKLELSDPDEPLTQHDVISFQKEALFRCLNSKRVELEALTKQYSTVHDKWEQNVHTLATLMSVLSTAASHLRGLCYEGNTPIEMLAKIIKLTHWDLSFKERTRINRNYAYKIRS